MGYEVLEVLKAVKAKLQGEGKSLGELQESFDAFTEAYISSEDKRSRIIEVKKYFNFYDPDSESYPGDYDSPDLLLGIMEEAMAYAVGQGLPYCEICTFLSFYISSIQLLVQKETDAIHCPLLRTVLENFMDIIIPMYSSCFSCDIFCDLVSYIKVTVFQHFHLYQFMLTQTQMLDAITVKLDVEVPEKNVSCLEEGILENNWIRMKKRLEDYEKKLQELDTSEASAMLQAEQNLKEVYQTQLEQFTGGETQKISPEKLSSIVGNLAEAHIEPTQVMMSKVLQKQEVDLLFRLDQLEHLWMQQEDYSKSESASARSRSASTSHSRNSGCQKR